MHNLPLCLVKTPQRAERLEILASPAYHCWHGANVVALSRGVDIALAKDNGVMIVRVDVAGRTADRVSFGSSAIADARGTVLRAGEALSEDILVAEVEASNVGLLG